LLPFLGLLPRSGIVYNMRYFIKSHRLIIGSFEIRETIDQVEPSFIAKRKLISLVSIIVIEDSFGVQIAQLQNKFFALLPSFIVTLCDGTEFELNRLFLSNEDARYEIVGKDWSDVDIRGDFKTPDYNFMRNGAVIAKVSKSDKSSTRILDIESSDSLDIPFILATMIGITIAMIGITIAGFDIKH